MQASIAVTLGDMNGIGPELLLKSAGLIENTSEIRCILVAPESVITFYAEKIGMKFSYKVVHGIDEITYGTDHIVYDPFGQDFTPTPGKISSRAGSLSMLALDAAINLIENNVADALVTAPISKESIHMAGYKFPGHTEYLAHKTSTTEITMMLVSGGLRVGLLTTHIPLARVPDAVSESSILHRVRSINQSLKQDFGIPKPKIAVLGLNPHAGDGGVLGSEEIEIIEPAISKLNQEGIQCFGPFPADGWFGMQQYENYDAVLAMYHDQGLAPFKALSFGRGVNFTAGLPIIRTSPDHGTAFAIAGESKAKTDSMMEAIKLAHSLILKRHA
jgi:4-hydroxythreonine-4-phosphate dehydrogenase